MRLGKLRVAAETGRLRQTTSRTLCKKSYPQPAHTYRLPARSPERTRRRVRTGGMARDASLQNECQRIEQLVHACRIPKLGSLPNSIAIAKSPQALAAIASQSTRKSRPRVDRLAARAALRRDKQETYP